MQSIIVLPSPHSVEGVVEKLPSPNGNIFYASADHDYTYGFSRIKVIMADGRIGNWNFPGENFDVDVEDTIYEDEEVVRGYFIWPGGQFYRLNDFSLVAPDGYLFVSRTNDIFLVKSEDDRQQRLYQLDVGTWDGQFLTPDDHHVVSFEISSDGRIIIYAVAVGNVFVIVDNTTYLIYAPAAAFLIEVSSKIRAIFSGTNFTEKLNDARIRNHCISYVVSHYGVSQSKNLYFIDDVGNASVICRNVRKVVPRGISHDEFRWYYVIFEDGNVSSLSLPNQVFTPLPIVIPPGEINAEFNEDYVTLLINPSLQPEPIPSPDSFEVRTEVIPRGIRIISPGAPVPLPPVEKDIPKGIIKFPVDDPSLIPFPGIEAVLVNYETETLQIPPDASWLNIARIIETVFPITQIKSLVLVPHPEAKNKFIRADIA